MYARVLCSIPVFDQKEEQMPTRKSKKGNDELAARRAKKRREHIEKLAREALRYFLSMSNIREKFYSDIEKNLKALETIVLIETVGNSDYFYLKMNRKKAATAATLIGGARTELKHIQIGLNRLESIAEKAARRALELLEKVPEPGND